MKDMKDKKFKMISNDNVVVFEGDYDSCLQFYTSNKAKYRTDGKLLSIKPTS